LKLAKVLENRAFMAQNAKQRGRRVLLPSRKKSSRILEHVIEAHPDPLSLPNICT
jgi:hypothetical protein